ncbi:MAG: M20/M25/M40 family metallo-hydrolase [Gemmatimonadales bacterium]
MLEQIARPALNVSGLSGGLTGQGSANLIVPRSTAFLDLRLVPNQTLPGVRRLIERHIARQGFHLVAEEPDSATLRSHPKVIRLAWGSGYPAAKTAMDSPAARAVIRAADLSMGKPLVRVPMLGGSLPLYLLEETLGSPFVLLPIVNHDNNQHGENENIRLANLWDGIDLYAGVLARLGSTWAPQP